jgi:hypothetical protein
MAEMPRMTATGYMIMSMVRWGMGGTCGRASTAAADYICPGAYGGGAELTTTSVIFFLAVPQSQGRRESSALLDSCQGSLCVLQRRSTFFDRGGKEERKNIRVGLSRTKSDDVAVHPASPTHSTALTAFEDAIRCDTPCRWDGRDGVVSTSPQPHLRFKFLDPKLARSPTTRSCAPAWIAAPHTCAMPQTSIRSGCMRLDHVGSVSCTMRCSIARPSDRYVAAAPPDKVWMRDVFKTTYDALIIPGGAKGAETMAANAAVQALVREFLETGKFVGMICAGG